MPSSTPWFCSPRYLAIGASLALVTYVEKHAAVLAFIQSEGIGLTDGVWVDGSDAAEEGVWRTATGDVMSYFGWTGVESNGGKMKIAWGFTEQVC